MNIDADIDGYAYGKLYELVENLFCDVRPAREKLLEHYAMLYIIAPTDFRAPKLRAEWVSIQRALKGKITNYGTERIPQERITVSNATIERVLRKIWNIYYEVHHDG